MEDLAEFYGPNAGYVLELYERYQRDPDSVDPRTRAVFAGWRPSEGRPTANGGSRGQAADALVRRAQPTASPPGIERPSSLTNGPGVASSSQDVARVVGAAALAQAIREYGHLGARLDPLGAEPPGDPELEAATHGIRDWDLAQLPASVVGGPAARGAPSALEAINALRRVYCDTTGYDYDHIHDAEERAWLRDAAETGRFRIRRTTAQKRQLLERLTQVEAFEQFLHRTFPGQKRFSIEGADMLIPMLDEAIRCQTQRGNREVVMGMAHRGRLNVLAHVLEKPYEVILHEFERADQRPLPAASESGSRGWTGDVKYHLGAHWPGRGSVVQVSITLAPNPSHLEFVNPVVEGMTRAAQDQRQQPGPPRQDLEAALAILIHGDAAFPGEGIVAETLNLSRLEGYQTGGTIHLIVNNQVGFTTEPSEGRSTLYAGDLAKGFEIPILHVNADDPEACLAAARLACAYRDRFHKDFMIDLVGYRRWGHNEADEPAFTQPRMYQVIRAHPTARQLWAEELERQGVLTSEDSQGMLQRALERLEQARNDSFSLGEEDEEHEEAGERRGPAGFLGPSPASGTESRAGDEAQGGASPSPNGPTPLSPEGLRALNETLLTWPPGFTLNRRLERPLERRRTALGPEGGVDWAQAESLAFATILTDGTAIRLTGQDVERGTFSQRHLVLHDALTGERYTPLQSLPSARASFAVYNSPLSENAPLGFEYGYSVHSPTVMVIWEAQFGDFANAGQVIIDQFIVSARAKWRQSPGLLLLLPHGFEGMGPEHSSARLERFLQLAAGDNIGIVNCTTAAQYFHLLRCQAARLTPGPGWAPRPLIVMSPKSLLRHPLAASTLEELAHGAFQPVIDEGPPVETDDGRRETGAAIYQGGQVLPRHSPASRVPAGDLRVRPDAIRAVTRLVLCSGKVAVDLAESPRRPEAAFVTVARVEELHPFPRVELEEVLARYPHLREVVWVQEEPENMGAWSFIAPRLWGLVGSRVQVRSITRPRRSSPAVGSALRHEAEQASIVAQAFEDGSRGKASRAERVPAAAPGARPWAGG